MDAAPADPPLETPPPLEARSIPELVSAAAGDLASLVRGESELVRTEVAENIRAAVQAMAWIGIGAALLLTAWLLVAQALVVGLSAAIGLFWASLLVAIALGGAGAVVIRRASGQLKPRALAPDRAARQLREDAQMIKEQVT